MKSAKDILQLLLNLLKAIQLVLRHPYKRFLSYLRSILPLAASWVHRITSVAPARIKRPETLESFQMDANVILPSMLPAICAPPHLTHVVAPVISTPSVTIFPSSPLDPSSLPLAIDANIVAVTSREFERYKRTHNKKDPVELYEYMLKPFTRKFPVPECLPSNWTAHTHPEGALYFHDKSRRILTDVYLYDPEQLEKLEVVIDKILKYTYTSSPHGWLNDDHSNVELVLELRQTGRYGYYFVDHARRCLFWPEEFNFFNFLDYVKVDYTISHVGQEMISHYWLHNEMFPHIFNVPEDAVEELKDTIVHAICDSLTSDSSTYPYETNHLEKMLSVVKEGNEVGHGRPGTVCAIYRLLHIFAHERFLNLYGEQTARLYKTQSIHPERPRSYMLKIFSPLLLYGPEMHFQQLVEMSVDSLVNKPSWTRLLKRLTDEWKEFTLYATVMLTANASFLAIQSIDEAAPPGGRSMIQRALYFSISMSIGAILLGLLLVRQHHVVLKMDFLANRSASSLGLEMLALMYSLPYGLLMWSMISFSVAFSLICFGSGDLITIILLAMGCFVLVLLLLWCISSSFEDSPYYTPWLIRQWNDRWKSWTSVQNMESDMQVSKSLDLC